MAKQRTLVERLHAAFAARTQRDTASGLDLRREDPQRDLAIRRFNEVCDLLRLHWESKLVVFSDYFRDLLKVTPTITPERRQVHVAFQTDLANMTMTLSASLSTDLRKVVIDYGLLLIPSCFEHERSARLEISLDAPDMDQVDRWVDDRLMSCVNAYLSIQDNLLTIKIIERLSATPGLIENLASAKA
jgi:hypothetical protein